jgi:hypothetical protein
LLLLALLQKEFRGRSERFTHRALLAAVICPMMTAYEEAEEAKSRIQEDAMIIRSCPRCKRILRKKTWLQTWKCDACGWQ